MALNPPKWAKILINLFLLVQKRVRKLMGVAINRYPGFILNISSFLLCFLSGLLNMRFSTSVFLSVSLCLASLCGIFTSAPAMPKNKSSLGPHGERWSNYLLLKILRTLSRLNRRLVRGNSGERI